MSDYLILVTRSAQKELDSLPVEISTRISARIDTLVSDPRPAGCIKLKGKQNQWRIRVGDYKVIYSIEDETFTIKILEVGHRREV